MKPRYLAAFQYSILALFFIGSWWILLAPLDNAINQLQVIYSPGYELRNFYIFYASTTAISLSLAITFMLEKSESKPLATLLAVIAAIVFAIAIWLFDSDFILGFGIGFACSIWHILSLTYHSSGTPDGAP